MKKQGHKQVYLLGTIGIVLCFLFLSTSPVKVYKLQEKHTLQPVAKPKAETDAFKQNGSWQWNLFFQHAGLLALLGMATGVLAGITDKTSGTLLRVISGALAGLVAGICLGACIYVWEFGVGDQIPANMYTLPEKAIDFNRE